MTIRQANAGRLFFQYRYVDPGPGGGWTTVRTFTLVDFPMLDAAIPGALLYTLRSVCPSFSGARANEEKCAIQYRPAPTLFTFEGNPATVYSTLTTGYTARVEQLAGSGHSAINIQVDRTTPAPGTIVYIDFEVEVVRGVLV